MIVIKNLWPIIYLRTMHCERIPAILLQHADLTGVAGPIPHTSQVGVTFRAYQPYIRNIELPVS